MKTANSSARDVQIADGPAKILPFLFLFSVLLIGGAIPALHHDTLDGFVANEHINWTGASVDFLTSGNVKSGSSDTTAGVFKAHGAGTGLTEGGCLQLHTAADYDTSINVYQLNIDEDDLIIKQGTTTKLTLSGATGNFTFACAGHDSFTDFVAAEHIDWTDTDENFLTTGTLGARDITGGILKAISRVDILDSTGETYYMRIIPGGTALTADRNFVIDLNNAARTLDLTGNATFGDYFNQSVKNTDDVLFNSVAATTSLVATTYVEAGTYLDADSIRTARDIGLEADVDLLQLAANALTVNGTITATSSITGNSLITASDIGLATDPDLIQCANNALTINGSLDATTINSLTMTGAVPNVIAIQAGTTALGLTTSCSIDQNLHTGASVAHVNINATGHFQVDGTQVVSNRVIDARCDDAINSGDATTDGVIDSLRDAMISHGLLAAE